ncbi:MAG: histidine kinase [Bacteroidota bacterium]
MNFISSAQQPAYSRLGEEQFKGIQIYDVIQDDVLNYWFATNEGIYLFNYTTFEKVECPKAKSNSAFNFVKNSKGIIYCHNLNNQVFQIKNKKCNLFYELQDDEGSADITLAVGDDGNLLVTGKMIIVLDKEGKVIKRFTDSRGYIGPPFQLKNKEIQYHLSNTDSILIYSKGEFSLKSLKCEGTKKLDVLKFIQQGDKCFAIEYRTKRTFSYSPENYELKELPFNKVFSRSGSIRLYETTKGIWLAGTLPGLHFLGNSISNSPKNVMYEDYFISDVYVDAEGNTLLSTFDKGILVIPNLKVPDVINPFRDDPVTTISSFINNELILGSSKGKLLSYSGDELIQLNSQGQRPIEVIEANRKGDLLIFDDGFIRGLNRNSGKISDLHDASLKAAVFVNDHEFYLGTNRGVVHFYWNGGNEFEQKLLPGLMSRVHVMAFNPINKYLYVSTADGFFAYSEDGEIDEIKWKNEAIFPNCLHYSNGKIYASTKENGVLIIKYKTIIDVIKTLVNEKIEPLKKLIIHNNTLIAKSSSGLFQFDMRGKLLKSIHSVFGFSTKRVIDFTFHKNELWVSHAGGVQQINLDYFDQSVNKPIVRIDKILVNGKSYAQNRKVQLSSNQRKIQFVFSSPTLRNRELIRYHYRLMGSDTNWSIVGYEQNQVTYNALSSGHYEFQVKVENQGAFSEVKSYSFTISAPFYIRWWFIVLTIILFLGLVFSIYRRQLAIQNKKAQQINELNASKLTAIQSQMNPHFIFNSLNSIQDLVLKGDVENSYSYITTFSNLVRRTLNYSEKDFIDFEQEIKLLELYLSLEKLRFKKDFNYSITYENVDDIMIPPLLVQPFIENALVHGLLHKEGEKRLKITFELKDVLICTVEDNGVGREKSRAIKMRQRSEHESFSGKAIQNRFEILSSVFNGSFGYQYEDLFEHGEGVGTRVVLKIPVRHKF